MIPHSRPLLGKAELEAVIKVLKSKQISQGKIVDKFEQRLASFIGLKGAVALNSGSSGLHLSLLALGIGKGDEVILPTYTCTALLNALNYTGARGILVDINRDNYNIFLKGIKKKIHKNTKAIIVPHMFGNPVQEIEEIVGLGIPVIEDCAQAIGAIHKDKKLGSFAILSVFSFYATKVIASGEGGMACSNSTRLLDKIRDLREYDEKKNYKVRYNYKLSELQAALGLVQLFRLSSFIKRRRKIAALYNEHFSKCNLKLPLLNSEHIFYRYIVEIKKGSLPLWLNKLEGKGIRCRRPIFRPLHQYLGMKGFPAAEDAWRASISIPIYPSLNGTETDKIIQAVKETFTNSHFKT